ncbi:DMT family transporter [Sneathiella chinensis]|uniref:Membrane protein n=1 Tax=Sneathiella chinensis TaxID=349750 RepID=A0ABQ5U897_9PROT|nr:DMT family transporter [Sneathiella chinensis]GLQ07955.1 membrane protein [Sneathiella chinensis]
MTAACFFLAVLGGLIKGLSNTGMHVFEIVLLRNLAGLVALAPWFIRTGGKGLKTQRFGLFSIRSFFGFVSMLSWFYAVTVVPLAEAVALNFTAPIFGTLLAIIFLKEVVRLRRWIAILVGFAGAMIILRPGAIELNPGTYAAIISAATMACSVTCVKKLSATESSPAIVAWTQILIIPMSLVPALFVWQTPTLEQMYYVVGMGVCATLGHLMFTRAFSLADATYVMPFDFFRLVFAAVIGFMFFSQQPDMFVWIGAAVIFVSAVYIAYREARTASERRRADLEGTIKAQAKAGPQS